MELYFPEELGEQLAFCAAAFVALAGFVIMFAPGYAMRVFGLQPREGRRDGYAEQRSMGGAYLALGLAPILLAQPNIYLVVGAVFAMAAFARIVSLLSDKGGTILNYLLLVVQIVLAALPLGYVFGFFSA
ncbi:hypothetical protein ASC97_25880 [Rhizobium sp. Root1203]|uniref:AGROH133_08824 family phage infection protein n=1 Tax=Rhizobium sp. Root1203 TaxID=1736427 RepID=UPI000708FF02|nr:hypothetical protein [Rhizobium sp. Root1203]KQV24339.1 hypothetical protein ASC97_25880 [Rhizobium sp. Root1203]